MNPGDIWCSACGRYHASLTVCPSFTTANTYAQGRREAAEAYCKGCSCMGPCDRQDTCVQYRTILGTASAEKTDKRPK